MSSEFHHKITDWCTLADQTAARSTHLAEIVHRKPTHLGFFDTSGLGAGGMWLEPLILGQDLVWRHPWPADKIANLVSATKGEGKITKTDLELASLVLN